MVVTRQQLTELHKMSLTDLKTQHKKLKLHTKKVSNKDDIVKSIQSVIDDFNVLRADLSKKYKCSVKPHVVQSYEQHTSLDLRQVQASIRQALRCSKYTKEGIINCFIKLCKILDYFIQY